jgi:transaldolase/glucose-6-phosphate isomerase
MNALRGLGQYGQSFWLDYIRRGFIESGELKKMIDEDGLSGVTSNPSIFEKAIVDSKDYDRDLSAARSQHAPNPEVVFQNLAIHDIREAADLLSPTYERSNGGDGYVSLEVSPGLAHDTQGTIREAQRLWKAVDRKNLMIKVPATDEGAPAIEALLSSGINVNVTLLFSQRRYEQVAWAYVRALEQRANRKEELAAIAGVASFFVSRIDTVVDRILTEKLKSASASERPAIQSLLGKVAIANARQAYRRFQTIFSGSRWDSLRSQGARPQRVLWASTSTKNPAYRDVLYIEELIGPNTINTMPVATANAFKDHGKLRNSLEENTAEADQVLANLQKVGVSLDEVTEQLLQGGVKQFAQDFQKVLDAIRKAVATKPIAAA